ncbi:histone-lysine N-methyltransferase [Dorcoceras hygrometricum]|uniref:Histone-lysine N-methyltransferase n=1 Tax=Dorcoceras hygrometricum TaxID=472368 RepID=A0A2Z7B0Q8_9LAMI|nr:histone-lysine N-methyltransferase [Dorcoceras hygrometricum]
MAAGAAPDYGTTDCAMACWPSAGQHATICTASTRRSGRPIAQQAAVDPPIRSTTGINLPPSICTRRLDGYYHGRNLLSTTIGASPITGRRRVVARTAARGREGGEVEEARFSCGNHASTCVTLNGSGIQLAVGPQPLRLRNHNFGLAHRIMVKRLATSPHDPLGITDSACKNQLIVVSVQYGPFNSYIPIRSMTIGYPRMRASGESSTTKHRLLHASGPHPIPLPNDPNIGYPRMSASGESSTTMHRLLNASESHPIPTPYDPKSLYCRALYCLNWNPGFTAGRGFNPAGVALGDGFLSSSTFELSSAVDIQNDSSTALLLVVSSTAASGSTSSQLLISIYLPASGSFFNFFASGFLSSSTFELSSAVDIQNDSSTALLLLAADVIVYGHNFFQSTMMTSSLLITASSIRHADVIIADSRSCGGRYRQSGPRPEMGFLHQPALEGLTRSARTDSPRQIWPETIFRRAAAAARRGVEEERGAAH